MPLFGRWCIAMVALGAVACASLVAPLFESMELRDALSAAPGAIASMPEDARRALARRLEETRARCGERIAAGGARSARGALVRPIIVAWLAARSLPASLVPDYVALVGIAGILGAPPAAPPQSAPPRSRTITARVVASLAITMARPEVPSGSAFEASARYRFTLGARRHLELGLEGRDFTSTEASHYALGVPIELAEALSSSGRLELTLAMIPAYHWIVFRSPFFRGANAWGMRAELGHQGLLGQFILLGGTPFAFNVLSDESIGVIATWEPRIWLGVTF